MNEFTDKIKRLKKLHAHSAEDAKQQIEQWETQMSRLKITQEWLNHPETKSLRNLTVSQLNAVVSRLANDAEMDDTTRAALFQVKSALLVYLAVLTNNPEEDMKEVESSVDFELEDEQ